MGAQGGGTVDTGTITKGNLAVAMADTCFGTMGVTTGKWYWEWALTGSSQSGMGAGWANSNVASHAELGYNSPGSSTNAQIVYVYLSKNPAEIISDAPKSASSGTDTSIPEISQNDIIGLAADFDNDKWYFSINGSFTNARSGQNPATGANPLCSATGGGGLVTIARTAGLSWFPAFGNWAASSRDVKVNFGQDSTFSASFSAGGNADENGFGDFKYTVPTGFLAMCSANASISDDIDPAQTTTDDPISQFNVVTWTGTGSTQSITGVNFAPDLVWLKRRNGTADHQLLDTTRGATYAIESNTTANTSSAVSDGLTAFGTDGFTLGTNAAYNGSTTTYVAWCWKASGGTTTTNTSGTIDSTVQANTAAGFSIVKWRSNNSANQTIGHGLSAAPRFIISKPYSASTWSWHVFHHYLGSIGNLQLNGSTAFSSGTNTYGAMPGASVFTVGTAGNLMPNNSTTDVISYCWHNVEGYSKFDVYEGNGNANGTFIYTGFRPRMLFIKRADGTGNWECRDTERDTYNPLDTTIIWDSDTLEASSAASTAYPIDILAGGFKIRTTSANYNTSGSNYIYGAWGDAPFKYNQTF